VKISDKMKILRSGGILKILKVDKGCGKALAFSITRTSVPTPLYPHHIWNSKCLLELEMTLELDAGCLLLTIQQTMTSQEHSLMFDTVSGKERKAKLEPSICKVMLLLPKLYEWDK